MNIFFALLTFSVYLLSPAAAQTVDRDSFEVGIEAYNAGNCKEAFRILKKYEKEQPSAAYVVKMCSLTLSSKKEKTDSYDIFLRDLNNGDLTKFEKLGFLARFQKEISGLLGAQYVNALHASAKKNDTNALFQLGLLYQEGIGVPRNFKNAFHYFEAAAKNGHSSAMNTTGLYHRFGIGTQKDEKKAEKWWKKSILNKNYYALYNLGRMYYDNKKFMMALLLSEMAVKRINPESEKKQLARAKSLLKRSKKKISSFHSAYIQKYRPFWLKPVLSEEEKKDLIIVSELPFPPNKMIEETSFMRFIRKDAFDNRYKTFFPFMPSWVSYNMKSPVNPKIADKKTPAPAPQEKNVISALYFRPSDPRYIDLTLSAEENAIPVMVGDIITLYVYTPLHETNATKKGGHMYIANTGYKINVQDPNKIITGNSSVTLTPLSAATKRQESWLSRTFVIQGEGKAFIHFVPQTVPDGTEIFPHSIQIVASKGKPPK